MEIFQSFEATVNRIPQSDVSEYIKHEMINDKYIDPDTIYKETLIGAGYYGLVYKGTLKRRKEYKSSVFTNVIERVALKRCNQSKTCNRVPCLDKRCWSIEQDIREAAFLLTLKSPYVVELKGITLDNTYHPIIIMPLYIKNQSLAQYLISGNKILLTQVTHKIK